MGRSLSCSLCSIFLVCKDYYSFSAEGQVVEKNNKGQIAL